MTTNEWGAAIWPEQVLGMGPYYLDTHPDSPGGTAGAWRGHGGWVGNPDGMRREAMATLACFEAGQCPCCGASLTESSPGWVRCPTSYATGPRSNRSDPIEYQVRPSGEVGGRLVWRVRMCTAPHATLDLANPASCPRSSGGPLHRDVVAATFLRATADP